MNTSMLDAAGFKHAGMVIGGISGFSGMVTAFRSHAQAPAVLGAMVTFFLTFALFFPLEWRRAQAFPLRGFNASSVETALNISLNRSLKNAGIVFAFSAGALFWIAHL